MFDPKELENRIVAALPDAQVRVEDLTGGGDHFRVQVISQAFAGLPMLKRHRLVYSPLQDVIGGAVHALALDTKTPDEIHQN
jgi:stress-induced morphogen